jgi:hypothetical protein
LPPLISMLTVSLCHTIFLPALHTTLSLSHSLKASLSLSPPKIGCVSKLLLRFNSCTCFWVFIFCGFIGTWI